MSSSFGDLQGKTGADRVPSARQQLDAAIFRAPVFGQVRRDRRLQPPLALPGPQLRLVAILVFDDVERDVSFAAALVLHGGRIARLVRAIAPDLAARSHVLEERAEIGTGVGLLGLEQNAVSLGGK